MSGRPALRGGMVGPRLLLGIVGLPRAHPDKLTHSDRRHAPCPRGNIPDPIGRHGPSPRPLGESGSPLPAAPTTATHGPHIEGLARMTSIQPRRHHPDHLLDEEMRTAWQRSAILRGDEFTGRYLVIVEIVCIDAHGHQHNRLCRLTPPGQLRGDSRRLLNEATAMLDELGPASPGSGPAA